MELEEYPNADSRWHPFAVLGCRFESIPLNSPSRIRIEAIACRLCQAHILRPALYIDDEAEFHLKAPGPQTSRFI